MSKKLTVQLLTHDNEATIEKTLRSLAPLDAHLVVLDHGSTDGTIEIARNLAEIRRIGQQTRSTARNALVASSKTDWHMFLEPWEALASGHVAILDFIDGEPGSGRLLVCQGDMLMKPVRLWHRSGSRKFNGRVFESLQPDDNVPLVNALVTSQIVDCTKYQLDLLAEWQITAPATAEPCYYAAMCHLSKSHYDEFLKQAENFLFRADAMTMPVIMTRYYLAWTHCTYTRNAHQALSNLMVCLSLKPLFAEFWCLLGDIYYFLQHDFVKAYRFYETAIIMGSKRKTGDEWPVQLSKYGEYPRKMIQSCKAIQESRKLIR